MPRTVAASSSSRLLVHTANLKSSRATLRFVAACAYLAGACCIGWLGERGVSYDGLVLCAIIIACYTITSMHFIIIIIIVVVQLFN